MARIFLVEDASAKTRENEESILIGYFGMDKRIWKCLKEIWKKSNLK